MYENDLYERPYRRNPMATAAVVFGILSLLCCAVFYLAVPLGALAVLFAILSRTGRRMPGKSKAGIVLGLCGMIATAVISAWAVHYLLTDPAGRYYLEQYYRYYTGDTSFELEDLGGLFGSDGEDPADDLPPVNIQQGEGVFL